MGNSKAIAFYVTISVVSFVISKIIMTILCYRRWKRKQMVVQDSLSGGKLVMFKSPKMNTLKSNVFLKRTMKLTNKDIIGSGGYGTVYKLTMNESISFAIKRLSRISAEQDRGFERELEAMGDIKHRNIVTLHGYYSTTQYNLLIYELMTNGSLDEVLHGKSAARKTLDWPSRYKIALGAARGLSYLHHDCIPHIIHRDIKSSNILLDHNMEARVSDFGLATLMEPDKTHVSTLVAGTFGYLAPEYFDTGKATVKGDVYSFGVVLLELLTGRKPTDEAFLEEGTKLVTWVNLYSNFFFFMLSGFTLLNKDIASLNNDIASLNNLRMTMHNNVHKSLAVFELSLIRSLKSRSVLQVKTVVQEKREEYVLDKNLEEFPIDEINHVFNIALMCLESDPCKRPTMAEVVTMLEQIKINALA